MRTIEHIRAERLRRDISRIVIVEQHRRERAAIDAWNASAQRVSYAGSREHAPASGPDLNWSACPHGAERHQCPSCMD